MRHAVLAMLLVGASAHAQPRVVVKIADDRGDALAAGRVLAKLRSDYVRDFLKCGSGQRAEIHIQMSLEHGRPKQTTVHARAAVANCLGKAMLGWSFALANLPAQYDPSFTVVLE